MRGEPKEQMENEKKEVRWLENRMPSRPFSRLFSHAAENGVFWMVILLGTLGFLSLFSAGRQAIRAGSGKIRTWAEGRNHKTAEGLKPICSVENGLNQVSLTFEITEETKNLDQILDILDACQVKAVFFISGDWAAAQPKKVKEMVSRGHELGNMGQSGKGLKAAGAEECQEQLRQVHETIRQLTGQEMNLFRPVQGDYDDALITTVCSLGYYPVLWQIDSQDWKDYGGEQIRKQVVENPELSGGSIIRFHCGAKYTPEVLESIITDLKEKGYELVLLSQMMIKENYRLDEKGRQWREP